MKTILCYGDSNTWGQIPGTGERFPRDVRWPCVMGDALGSDYHVIEEGLPGRTTVWEHPFYTGLNGAAYLDPCLRSHAPLDLVTIMLGTNDLYARYAASTLEIAAGVGQLAEMSLRHATVLLIAPPVLGPVDELLEEHLAGGETKSRRLPGALRMVAEGLGCRFLDASTLISSSEVDGIHFDAGAHEELGRAVAEMVRELLSWD